MWNNLPFFYRGKIPVSHSIAKIFTVLILYVISGINGILKHIQFHHFPITIQVFCMIK
jgi:hypothetical protein